MGFLFQEGDRGYHCEVHMIVSVVKNDILDNFDFFNPSINLNS